MTAGWWAAQAVTLTAISVLVHVVGHEAGPFLRALVADVWNEWRRDRADRTVVRKAERILANEAACADHEMADGCPCPDCDARRLAAR